MYGEVQAAPDMTSDFSSIGGSPMPLGPDTSMLGASLAKDVPSFPPADTQVANEITPNIHDSVISEPPVVAPEPTPSAPSGPPPVPAEGLPPGWSMDQWEHYGEQWLSQQE
jgi:hypothetical protein